MIVSWGERAIPDDPLLDLSDGEYIGLSVGSVLIVYMLGWDIGSMFGFLGLVFMGGGIFFATILLPKVIIGILLFISHWVLVFGVLPVRSGAPLKTVWSSVAWPRDRMNVINVVDLPWFDTVEVEFVTPRRFGVVSVDISNDYELDSIKECSFLDRSVLRLGECEFCPQETNTKNLAMIQKTVNAGQQEDSDQYHRRLMCDACIEQILAGLSETSPDTVVSRTV